MTERRDEQYTLAFVIGRYFEFGGLQRDMRRIALACAARGHDVHVLAGGWKGESDDSLNFHPVDLRAWTNHGRNEKLGRIVSAVRDREHYDCITGFDRIPGLDVYFAGDVCLKARIMENKPWCAWYYPRYRVYLRHERAVYGVGGDTDILLLTPAQKQSFVRHYGTEDSRLHLLPPGIDRGRLSAQSLTPPQRLALRRELGVPDDGRLLLTVGSGFHTKGVDRAIRAVAKLPSEQRAKCLYVVVGVGRASGYRRLAARLKVGGQVSFLGGRDDVGRLYHAADLLLHPARLENTGTVLLEAMVCGLPVLATANCGYAHHIEDAAAGRVCGQPFAQARLARALTEVLLSDNREQWRQNALRYCASRDLYSMTDRAVEIIERRAARNRRER